MSAPLEMPGWTHGQLNRISGLDLPASVRTLVERHTKLFHEWAAASTASATAATARDRAEAADRENRAAAIAKNQPPPKPGLPAATKAAAEAHERAGDLVRAVIIVEGEIPAAVAAHQRDLLGQVDSVDDAARATIRDALQTVEAALMTLAHNSLLRPTVAAPHDPRSWRPSWPAPTLTGEVTNALAALGVYAGAKPRPFYADGHEHVPSHFLGGVSLHSQGGPDDSVELDDGPDYSALRLSPA